MVPTAFWMAANQVTTGRLVLGVFSLLLGTFYMVGLGSMIPANVPLPENQGILDSVIERY